MERARRQRDIEDLEREVAELQRLATPGSSQSELERLQEQVGELRREFYAHLGAWQRTQLARHPQRPYTLDLIRLLFTDFSELHGDRCFGDDPAIVAGFARFHGRPVLVLGHQKGRDTKQRLARNFGQAKPEGYRKALRLMNLAAKFGRPVFTFVDTPGAYPGIDAEERGQAEAIAHNLSEMARLPGADYRHDYRRRRLRRRSGHRRRRQHQHPGERNLLGDFAGRMRLHPVARRRQGRNRRPGFAHYGQ